MHATNRLFRLGPILVGAAVGARLSVLAQLDIIIVVARRQFGLVRAAALAEFARQVREGAAGSGRLAAAAGARELAAIEEHLEGGRAGAEGGHGLLDDLQGERDGSKP